MDIIGKTISNLVRSQFPEHYREHGPIFVAFIEEYYRWLESQTESRDDWFVDKVSLVRVTNRSANVIGLGSFFETQFANGDQIAISKGEATNDYEMFTIKTVANNTLLILRDEKLPNFSHANTKYATVSDKPNALFLTRNFPDINDIDLTLDQFVVYFKEKYLKGLQFKTITDTKTLIKHSLDLYRSKGTERSVDLLYKIAFGKPAKIYYPGQDIFRLSSGDWYIPKYLELSLSLDNNKLINRQIVGVLSGATAFVEEIIRRVVGDKVVEVAYISAIDGTFISGEKVTLSDISLQIKNTPTIVGSLNQIEININGSGSDFEENELVNISSINGRGGIGKVITTSNTSGQVSFALEDGGYGFSNTLQVSNTTGNVSVNVISGAVNGTGTLFDSEYIVGDYISVYSTNTVYETHQITSISSNTLLQTGSSFLFNNTQTKAAYSRYFAQTFVSEKILTISNATFSVDYMNYEYIPFSEEITQPLALLNYENANGDFTAGEHIFTYYPNNFIKGEGHILTISKKTSSSGLLTIAPMSGNCEATAIYTTANAIGANLAVANGYADMTAVASVIGNYSNVVVTTNNWSGTFTDGEIILQPETQARGIVASAFLENANVDLVITITDSQGIFKNGFNVSGNTSGATATVVATDIEIGVVDVVNAFSILPNNHIHTANGQMAGTLTSVSLGSGANITFSNTLIYSENIVIATDLIYPFLPLFVGATSWPFTANASANLSAGIGNTLSYTSLTIGKVSELLATSPGTDYNKMPIIRLHDPVIFDFDIPDMVKLTVSDAAGFVVGGVLTQAATNARGLIRSVEGDEITLQNMRFYANNSFVITSNTGTQVVGSLSGLTTNVSVVEVFPSSPRYGSDVTLESELIIASGAVTSVQILDSGFAFANGEQVVITSGTKSADAYAVLQTHGTGSGYYKTSDGFLSDIKKLSDGWYWQEYSYEVRSAVIDDFKKILKKIVHVSGTKSFDALVYDSINTLQPTVEQTMALTGITQIRLRDDSSYLLLRNGTDKLLSGYGH